MSVRLRGREVAAEVQSIRTGFFLRASQNAVFGIQRGSIIDVDGTPCIVRWLIAGDPCDPEVWAILLPVRNRVRPQYTQEARQ